MTTDAAVPGHAGSAGRSKLRVIFICTGNSARSQMAEALLRKEAGDRFEIVSGGVDPRPVHPMAIAAMAKVGIDISGAESKSLMRFATQSFDYVVTVCDRARAACPVFPGAGEVLHWGIEDPVEAEGTEAQRQAAFDRALRELSGRIHAFIGLATPRGV
jgi:arsenate reductase (thioredoxin)